MNKLSPENLSTVVSDVTSPGGRKMDSVHVRAQAPGRSSVCMEKCFSPSLVHLSIFLSPPKHSELLILFLLLPKPERISHSGWIDTQS